MKNIFLILIAIFCISCSAGEKDTLIVFHAGSLSSLMKEFKQEFEKKYDCTVLLEASGSVDAARKIIDLNKRCDVIALADIELFDTMLKEYCPYSIAFAGNEMVLAYSPKSKYAKNLSLNWLDTMKHNDILCARSDPFRDPCGYRTLLVWELASDFYNDMQLKKIFEKRSPKEYMRPKEVDCIALLETAACDALWIYKSVASTHGFPYVRFDDSINLSNTKYNRHYKKHCINLSEGAKKLSVCATAITYGISILVNALNTHKAKDFVAFICSQDGKKIIQHHGFTVIPPYSKQWDALPLQLKKVVGSETH